MLKHTPGPWETMKCSTGNVLIFGSENIIAVVQDMSALSENTDANVNLIAAAPDMLEALQNIIDASAVGDNIDFSEILMAIAKAKGE